MRLIPRWKVLRAKASTRGSRWLVRRMWLEVVAPQYRASYLVISTFRKLFAGGTLGRSRKSSRKEKFLACYTLSDTVTSFDFAYFLAAAEAESLLAGFDSFQVLFVRKIELNDTRSFEKNLKNEVTGKANSDWRFQNIVVPLLSLMPSCRGYQLVEEKSVFEELAKKSVLYPKGYSWHFFPSLDFKEMFRTLASNPYTGFLASEKAMEKVSDWLSGNGIESPIVTITLRRRKWDPARNSSLDDWARFAEWLTDRGYRVVTVPDSDSGASGLPGLLDQTKFLEASWNLGVRLALYETAMVNFGVNNGPLALMHLDKNVSYVQIFFTGGSEMIDNGRYYSRVLGVDVGDLRLPFGLPGQLISWGGDDFHSLCRAFEDWEADRGLRTMKRVQP